MAIRTANVGGGSSGSPFSQAAPAAPQTTTALAVPMTFKVTLPGGATANVATQAEVDALRAAYQQQQTVDLRQPGSGGGGAEAATGGFLNTAADAGQAVVGFLAGRNIRSSLQDLQDARDRRFAARDKLAGISASDPSLQKALLDYIDADLDSDQATMNTIESELSAIDISAGTGVIKVVNDLVGGQQMGSGAGLGTVAAVGAGAVGLGLLLNSGNNNRNSLRRR